MSYVEDTLHCVHTFNDIFWLGRASQKAKAKANALRIDLMKKRKVDEKTHAETWKRSKYYCEINSLQDNISNQIDGSKGLEADFNFRKIHLIYHWVKQIYQYGSLQLYSTERHKEAHQTYLKVGVNASDHNLNDLPQVITFHRRILCFEIRELIHQALPQHQEDCASTCKVLPSAADLATPLSSQSYAKPEFMGPQHSHDGKHPDAMMKDFKPLLNNTHDATHSVATFSSMREFIKHTTVHKMYISHEQLDTMERCICDGIKIQVEG